MASDNDTRSTHRSKGYTQIAPETSQISIFTPSKHDQASPGPKQPFITLTKPFDVNPKAISYPPQDFDVKAHSRPSEEACGADQHEMQAKHNQIDRPWASKPRRQQLEKSDIDPLKWRATDTQFSRWMSESIGEAPYHMVDSVKGDFESRLEQKNGKGLMKGKGSGDKAATW